MGSVDMDRVLGQFDRLVRIDSLTLGERQMADVLKAELEALGFEVTEDDAGAVYGSDTGNLYGFLKGTDPSREPLLFSAHMDTVPPGEGKVPVIDWAHGLITSAGDTVLGSDDVSGIVEILEGVRVAKEDPAGYGDIEVLFTISEEVYCRGAAVFDYSKLRSKKAYVVDMSGRVGAAAAAAPSIYAIEFTIHGKAAHAGFAPETGINAIAAAARIIAETPQGSVADGVTLNIGTIEGGTVSNIVSESCRCVGEARGLDHDAAEKVVNELRDRIDRICAETGATYEFNANLRIHAYKIPADAGVCRSFRKACAKLGLEGKITTTRGGSDNHFFVANGLDGIVISSGMSSVHTTSEYICIEDLELGCKLITALIRLG